MLLLPYAKDVAQRQQSFAAAVVELTGQVKVKFPQKLLPCPPPMPRLAHPLYSLSLPALYNLQRQKTNKCFSVDLNPFRNRSSRLPLLPSFTSTCGQQAALRRRLPRGKFVMQMASDLIIALDN